MEEKKIALKFLVEIDVFFLQNKYFFSLSY